MKLKIKTKEVYENDTAPNGSVDDLGQAPTTGFGKPKIIKLKVKKNNEAKSGSKEEYMKYFDSMLSKYKVNSPAELSDSEKKKFFDEVDRGWIAQDEK